MTFKDSVSNLSIFVLSFYIPFWHMTKWNIKLDQVVMKKTIYSKEHEYLIEKLKVARESAGLDQVEVAKLLGKSQSFISKVESGQRRVDIIQLKEFARVYKKALTFFIK
jgi:ribosome-binding protein aMBF1 (putative translation factor)